MSTTIRAVFKIKNKWRAYPDRHRHKWYPIQETEIYENKDKSSEILD